MPETIWARQLGVIGGPAGVEAPPPSGGHGDRWGPSEQIGMAAYLSVGGASTPAGPP